MNSANEKFHKGIETERGDYAEFGNPGLSCDYLFGTLEKLNFPKNSKMLDIGTNKGTLPYLAYSKHGFNMYGIEMREDAVQRGKLHYPDIADKLSVTDGTLNNISDESYDVITMFDVMEHIPNLEVYLKSVFRILRWGGVLVFQTPNKRINPIFEIIRSKSLTAYKEYHCSLQTPRSLKKILNSAGFSDVVVEKNSLDSELNRRKLKKYFGIFANVILGIFQKVPLCIFPNLWGCCRKDTRIKNLL